MTNSVTVTASFGATAEGNFLFVATGTLVSDANAGIILPVVNGVLDSSGNLSASLVASDNYGLGELTWNVFITVRGMSPIEVYDVVINFSAGASQNLFAILEANGWTPLST